MIIEAQDVFDISFGQSILVSCALPLIFVGSLYIWPNSSSLTEESRDLKENVIKRFISVAITSFLALLICVSFVKPGYSTWDAVFYFGFHPSVFGEMAALVLPLIHIMILFLGPLLVQLLRREIDPFRFKPTKDSVEHQPLTDSFFSIPLFHDAYIAFHGIITGDILIWRNILVAPAVEEWVFRSCMCTLLLAAGWSPFWTILGSPLFFGLAHLHHLRVHPWPQVVGQFAYTTLFGWIAAYYFVRTRYFLAPAIAHAFCNHMGFPRVDLINETTFPGLVKIAYVVGLISFFFTADMLTTPSFYGW